MTTRVRRVGRRVQWLLAYSPGMPETPLLSLLFMSLEGKPAIEKQENHQNLSEGMFAHPSLYYKRRFWRLFACIDAIGNLDVQQSMALDRWSKRKSDRLATCLRERIRAQKIFAAT